MSLEGIGERAQLVPYHSRTSDYKIRIADIDLDFYLVGHFSSRAPRHKVMHDKKNEESAAIEDDSSFLQDRRLRPKGLSSQKKKIPISATDRSYKSTRT